MRYLFSFIILCTSLLLSAQSELSIGQVEFRTGSNALPSSANLSLLLSGDYTSLDFDQIIDDLPSALSQSVGISLNWISFEKKAKDGVFGFQFSVSDEIIGKGALDGELVSFLWRGTKQYQGETLGLNEFDLNYTYFRKFSAGIQIPLDEARIIIAPHVYQALASFETIDANSELFFDEEGEFIDVDANIKVNYSETLNNPFQSVGFGAGIDLGIESTINDWEFSIFAYNLGAMRINKGVQATSNGSFRFEGVDVLDTSEVSYIRELFRIEEQSGKYTQAAPSRIQIQVNKQYGSTSELEVFVLQPLFGRYYTSNAPYLQVANYIGLKNIFRIAPMAQYQFAEGFSAGLKFELGVKYFNLYGTALGLDFLNTNGGNAMFQAGLSINL